MVKTAVAERTNTTDTTEASERVMWQPVHPEYHKARSVDEAIGLLGKYGTGAKIVAGGLDLVSLIKRETLPAIPSALVSIMHISGLNQIAMRGGTLSIGALARINDLERSPVVREYFPMLTDAAYAIGSPQIRNMATVAGNICQDVRCLYYRRPKGTGTDFHCHRKTPEGECYAVCGENREHSIFGSAECIAPCVSDMAVALTAYNARLLIKNTAGGRSMTIPELFMPLGKTLGPDELITEIIVPEPAGSVTASFHKFRIRKAIDFAIVSAAAVISTEKGIITNVGLAVGGVASAPYYDEQAGQYLIGKTLSKKNASEAAEILVSKAMPMEKNAYKVQITRALVSRAILGETEV